MPLIGYITRIDWTEKPTDDTIASTTNEGLKLNPITHIIAIRHGETDWNRKRQYQGQEDIALNDRGFAQAKEIAVALANTSLNAIYASDLKRAHQTAGEIACALRMTPLQVAGLREQHFGVFQGLTGEEVAKRWPDASTKWYRRVAEFGPDGGETRNAFSRRCVAAMHELAQAHVGGTIAIVCHGGVLDCLYRAASNLPMDAPRTWSLENAAINRLTHDARGFAILSWGDTGHLHREPTDDLIEHFPGP